MEAYVLNNLLCYYTENDVSEKSQENFMISFVNPRKDRSSCSQMFFKVNLLKIRKFHRKTPVLNKVAALFLRIY